MVYTKKGDRGKTGLFGIKKRVSKASQIIRAIGAIDEANSYLGILRVNNKLTPIQENLVVIGSILAGAKLKFPVTKTRDLEKEIDKLEKRLPALKKFIIPKGHLMYARALVRRAEREVVGAGKMKPEILKYLNRLSDYFFILARWKNFHNLY